MPLSPRLLRPLATGFNPKSISGLALWLDATDRSTLLNSIEPNVTATDGQTVRRWLDKSGNARHAEQSTGANQPTIQADGLVFDGTNDVLAITSGGSITNNVPFLGAFAVYTWASSPTTQKAVVSFSTTNSGNARFHLLGGTVANKGRVGGRRLNADTIANLDTTGDLPTARFIHSGIARYATAEAEVRVNGAVGGSSSSFQTAGNTSADDSAVAWIGAAGAIGASNLANITVRELLIYNATMTASQVTAVERYLARKHGVSLYSPPSYADADVNAYISAVELADGGLMLETGVRDAINDFITGCKADGIWTAIKASCILMGARTLSGALTPLVGTAPTNVGPFVAGDYGRKTGLIGNGSSKYLNSNRNANADPQDNFHMSVAMSASGTGISMGAGAASSGATQFSASDIRCRSASAFTRSVQSADAGLRAMNRTTGAEFVSRWLGSNETHTNASQTPFNGDIFVFARNSSGAGLYSNMRCYWYSIGESLNLTLLDTRVAALHTAIGAAI